MMDIDSDVVSALTPQQREQMIAENVASIEAVPLSVWDALPFGRHNRTFALVWARDGRDVYCYHSAAGWQLWLEHQRIELSCE